MKKLDSIELLHANGDSTILVKESIVDIVIEEVTQNWELGDEYSFDKVYSCSGFHLEILYNSEEDDKEAVERLLDKKDLAVALNFIGNRIPNSFFIKTNDLRFNGITIWRRCCNDR